MKVMLALAGEQPMANFIPIVQQQPDVVEFVVSERTEMHAGQTIETMKVDKRTRRIRAQINPRVDAYDVASIERECSEIADRHVGEEMTVNLTGGTKLMSLGAYRMAVARGLRMIYVATEKGVVIHYDGRGVETTRQPLSAPLPPEVHFAAHGIRASSKQPWPTPYLEVAHFLAERAVSGARVINEARRSVSQTGQARVVEQPSPAETEVAHRLYESGLLALKPGSGDALVIRVADDARARDFLAGKWLELWVYEAARDSGLFDYCAFDVRIEKPGGEALILNQLDVVLSLNARLIVCSCKTEAGDLMTKEDNKGIIYELDSISRREQAGIYCGKVLVTHLVNLPAAFQERAHNSHILVVTGDRLLKVGQEIAKAAT